MSFYDLGVLAFFLWVNFFLLRVGPPILASNDFASSEKLVKNARLD